MDIDRRLLSEELVLAAESLAESFAARSVRNALIGGLAISMRGRPRLTQDIDKKWAPFAAIEGVKLSALWALPHF
jgi:hypothetical protein